MPEQEHPRRIYLQHHDEYYEFFGEEITWCSDRVNDDDLEYISIDALLEFIDKIENESFSGVDDFVDQGRAGVANELLMLIRSP